MPIPPNELSVSDKLIHFLKNEEGFRDKAYQDSGGVWTFGYGNTTSGGAPVRAGMSIAKENADTLLKEKANEFANVVKSNVKVPLTQNEFEALTSFAYNVGPNNFKSSTLLKKLNSGDKTGVEGEFRKWIYDNNKNPVLRKRREKEIAYFKTGEDTSGGPAQLQVPVPEQIPSFDSAGGTAIAEATKKKVVPSTDSSSGVTPLREEIALPPGMSSMYAKAGQQSPLDAVNPANLFFSPAYAQSQQESPQPITQTSSQLQQLPQPVPLQQEQPRPLDFPQPQVPQQTSIQTPKFLRNIGQGLAEQPTDLYNVGSRFVNQALIAGQDLGNLGQDVDKSNYFTLPSLTPEDITVQDVEFEKGHPVQAIGSRILGDTANTVFAYNTITKLPVNPFVKAGLLAAYFGALEVGRQVGEKGKEREEFEPNPAIATGGLPDLNPQNQAA